MLRPSPNHGTLRLPNAIGKNVDRANIIIIIVPRPKVVLPKLFRNNGVQYGISHATFAFESNTVSTRSMLYNHWKHHLN